MKLTVRGRLTLVYGSLFVAAGLVLLGATYVLVSHQLPAGLAASLNSDGPTGAAAGGPTAEQPSGQIVLQQIVQGTRTSALHTLLTQGAIALVVVSAAAIALGWLIAGRMLQPLHQITETARRIAGAPAADRGLHERIGLAGPRDEIKELADTFDLMLARLDDSFDGQRRFIANASHELRTPLTLNRTLLEVALEPASASPEVRQLGSTLLAINDRHGRLIDGLLLLAQSERTLTDRAYVDLADIVDHVAATETGPVKVVTTPGEAATWGNPVLLERLVQNLVENGIRHNVPDLGWVHVTTGRRLDGWAMLEVTNSGPSIPRYEVPGLFEPFRRYGSERLASPGAGLGLSIVRAVARAHGGDARAEARDEGGLVVTVALPGAS
jgi:signal transduction histidine kinase